MYPDQKPLVTDTVPVLFVVNKELKKMHSVKLFATPVCNGPCSPQKDSIWLSWGNLHGGIFQSESRQRAESMPVIRPDEQQQ
jgi:hypothetical protein